ncbi:MAG: mannose-1-phosphate guanylyltransferase [Bacteroidetes bacterium HGW-Bacteroidetes-21]|jgi:mannose-1-phosphate guanylyltransferase|nr:MAG: mannose-1-phosphate guanylyltransferase [Bacteroidetes bacterium HGW-Bacteroidetes-21]
MKDVFCIIMAGGAGTRFWPVSRQAKPKQFIDILGIGKTFLQQTFDRFVKICPPENIFIVTHTLYKDLVLEQLPQIKSNQILLEPMRKNTAPCIAYANYRINKINPNAITVVAPADHLILNEQAFKKDILSGINFCRKNDMLLTIGIKPSRPETGYGYIQIDSKISFDKGFNKVKTFTEKPDLEMAKVFLKSGEFFWNSGIFVWSLKSISEAFKTHLEEVDALFAEKQELLGTRKETAYIQNIYNEVKSISIDYGIMEKASNVAIKCADFGWSDLGTWSSLYDNSTQDEDQNVIRHDNVLAYHTKETLFDLPPDKLALVYGLKNYVVAERDNLLLICPKDEEKVLRDMVNDMKFKKGEEFS